MKNEEKMQAVEIRSVWYPRAGSEVHPRDVEKIRAQQGSRVWMQPTASLIRTKRPELRDTEVLIRVRACGLCGSDVSMAAQDHDGYARYPFMMRSPIIPGHEFAGEVVDMGSRAAEKRSWLKRGVPVTAQCVLNCGACDNCLNGEFDSCIAGEELGFTRNGGMAEYCAVDARHVWSLLPLSDHYRTEDQLYLAGSLIEPMAGVFKGLNMVEWGHGDTLLIIGAGPIGLSALLVAQALRFGNILVAEVWRERRVKANRLGASHSFCPLAHKLSDVVLELTGGRGADVVFEASGYAEKNWDELNVLWRRQKADPRMVFFGQSKKELPFNPQLPIQRYAKFVGSHGHTKVWYSVIRMVGAGRINPLPMITRTISLQEAPEWLKRLQTDKSECKVTITEF